MLYTASKSCNFFMPSSIKKWISQEDWRYSGSSFCCLPLLPCITTTNSRSLRESGAPIEVQTVALRRRGTAHVVEGCHALITSAQTHRSILLLVRDLFTLSKWTFSYAYTHDLKYRLYFRCLSSHCT